MITRRNLLKAIAAGGGIVAGELWIPGAVKVFLPSRMADLYLHIAPGHLPGGMGKCWSTWHRRYPSYLAQTEVMDDATKVVTGLGVAHPKQMGYQKIMGEHRIIDLGPAVDPQWGVTVTAG